MSATKLTAAAVADGIRRRYGTLTPSLAPEWADLDEFSLMPGAGTQRIDLFFIRAWRSGGHTRHAIEIKVSRTDLKKELADLRKSAFARSVSHEFWLATPKGLIRDEDPIPEGWGVYEVDGHKTTVNRRARRNQDVAPLPYEAAVEAFRRAGRAEGRIRAAESGDLAAELVTAQRERDAAVAAQIRARDALRTARDRTHRLADILVRFTPLPCQCGADLVIRRGGLSHATSGGDCRWPTVDIAKLPQDTPDGS